MNISSSKLTTYCGGESLSDPLVSTPITEVLVDSRQLIHPESTVFFALKGPRRDGHDFIADLYHRGVRHFVIAKKSFDPTIFPGALFILVVDPLDSLQYLAKTWRARFHIPILAITGSNGKTLVKEWLGYLLEQHIQVTKSPKSYNSQIGVALSVLKLSSESELGIFEAGISTVGEMKKLADIIQPSHGLLTNIGSAHDAGFESQAEKLAEKIKLFSTCKLVINCKDHEPVKQTLAKITAKKINWSIAKEGADLWVQTMDQIGGRTRFTARWDDRPIRFEIPFTDLAAIENALHCLCYIAATDKLDEAVLERFQTLPQISMRLEVLQAIHNCVLINDCYNADLESLQIALSQSRNYPLLSKTLIVSDFEQLKHLKIVHERLYASLEQNKFRRVIAIGTQLSKDDLPSEIMFQKFASTQEFLTQMSTIPFDHDLIVLKGARSFRFEEIVHQLTMQSYGGRLEINLSAVAQNIKLFAKKLHPETKIMAMIKAAAYGSGALPMARFLASREVDYLGVAYTDEGIELRRGGLSLPIMVLKRRASFDTPLFTHNLEPEVHSFEMLRQLQTQAMRRDQRIKVHINLDTGMSRLGFGRDQLAELCSMLPRLSHIHVQSIFSHLAASDNSLKDEETHLQASRFEALSKQLQAVLDHKPIMHLLNSNGIVRFPEHQYQMVRLGIGMYGIGVSLPDLIPAHRLLCRISHIRLIQAGTSIGYGQTETATRRMRIATIGIGYADGLIRKVGNRRYSVLINGQSAPIVGTVCMDMAMIDISEIEGVQLGDDVVIFGPEAPIAKMADAAETIPYEIFTSISRRVRKVYTRE